MKVIPRAISLSILHHRVGHAGCPHAFFDIVYSDYVGPVHDGHHQDGQTAFHSLLYRQFQGGADETFAGGSDQYGQALTLKRFEVFDYPQVLLLRFTKTDTGIDDYLLFGETRLFSLSDGFIQFDDDVGHQIFIGNFLIKLHAVVH